MKHLKESLKGLGIALLVYAILIIHFFISSGPPIFRYEGF